MLDRHDLTDEQWAQLEPHLPPQTGGRGGQWADHRQVLNGVMWRTRTGSPWRDLPECYGKWKTVYNRHRRWSGDGTWEQAWSKVRVGADQDGDQRWVASVDGTVIRAHHHAAGARHEPPKDIPAHRLAPTVLSGGNAPGQHTGGRVE
ncbi:MAG: IS5 family transposase [Ornithinimicrobium sp.]|uniref:IS5 family transposase n=1 Tax=Ornithinimicrobium sp. TaxID=1977084 RepID=UPI003D9BE763